MLKAGCLCIMTCFLSGTLLFADSVTAYAETDNQKIEADADVEISDSELDSENKEITDSDVTDGGTTDSETDASDKDMETDNSDKQDSDDKTDNSGTDNAGDDKEDIDNDELKDEEKLIDDTDGTAVEEISLMDTDYLSSLLVNAGSTENEQFINIFSDMLTILVYIFCLMIIFLVITMSKLIYSLIYNTLIKKTIL